MADETAFQLRQRKDIKSTIPAHSTETAARDIVRAEDEQKSIWLDIARSLVFLLLLSTSLSYFITRESFFWNIKRPAFTYPANIKFYFKIPLELTDAALRKYDGSDPSLPIYLAINGTIYDVSPGRRFYGPGGSYHFFAGADGSRAFVTNCFDSDIMPDMRGVEEMFLPVDDVETDSLYTKGELKILREREGREARKEVHKALKHWVDFFEGNKKYAKVGKVKRAKGWEERGEKPVLCEKAQKARKKRAVPEAKGVGQCVE